MTLKWVRRRGHQRRLLDGGLTEVAPTWVLMETGDTGERKAFTSTCPVCGADVLSLRMLNGGWIHVEPGARYARVKHPCLYRGEDIADTRDGATGDLFGEYSDSPSADARLNRAESV